jgi:hypothetical protein
VRLGNERVTGITNRYLEFDIFLRTDQTVALGAQIFWLKFDSNLFGNTYITQDTNKFKISAPTILQNKITTGIYPDNAVGAVMKDTMALSIGQVVGQVVLLSNTEQVVAHIRMKISACGSTSGLRFVKQSKSVQYGLYNAANGPYDYYYYYANGTFTQPNFRITNPNSLYLCPPAEFTISPSTARAGVGDWITLTPPVGSVLSAQTHKVQFRDADSDDVDFPKISVSDSVQFLTNPVRVRVRVPGSQRLNGNPVFTGLAGTGTVYITSADSSLATFKSTTSLNVEYAISETYYSTNTYERGYLSQFPNCSKIYQKFVIDTASIRVAWAGNVNKRDSVIARINDALTTWKTKLNQTAISSPTLGINWVVEYGVVPLTNGAPPNGVCFITTENLTGVSADKLIVTRNTRYSNFLNQGTAKKESISGSVIKINTSQINGFSLLATGSNIPASKNDFYANFLHEIGHALGLNHVVASQYDLMNPYSPLGLSSAQRQSLTSGTNQTLIAIKRQITDSKNLKWASYTPIGSIITPPIYSLGSSMPSGALRVISNNGGITVIGGGTKTFSITTGGTVLSGQNYIWEFFETNNTWRKCAGSAETRAVFSGYGSPTLSVKNNCDRKAVLNWGFQKGRNSLYNKELRP